MPWKRTLNPAGVWQRLRQEIARLREQGRGTRQENERLKKEIGEFRRQEQVWQEKESRWEQERERLEREGGAAERERKAQASTGGSATSGEAIGGALLTWEAEGESAEAGTQVGEGAWPAPPQEDS